MSAAGAPPLRLATRGSALALAQTGLAAARLVAAGVTSTETVVIRTRGDREADTPASAMEGMGWFTADLEAALLDGRADAAVHSAKDLPTEPALGARALLVVVDRGDPRDAIVTRDGGGLAALPAGARVGTSSLRREHFLRALRPDVEVQPMRGNVDTRLRKLDAGEVDAVLLACAGLDRLGLGDRIAERLDPTDFVPAPAQGAIAVEGVGGTAAALHLVRADDPGAAAAVRAERTVLSRLGGGCRLPLGAWARLEAGRLVLAGALAVDGEVRRAELSGDPERPVELGERVAAALRGPA